MIEQVDTKVQAWVQGILPDTEVVVGPLHQFEGKQGVKGVVNLYLLALADSRPAWANHPVTKRIALHYFITTWGKTEEEAHALLSKLVFAAWEQQEYELSLSELPLALWSALGVLPRPAFTLWVPCAIEQPQPETKLVRGPLAVQGAPVRNLFGLVLGPGNMPIMGAGVELPALQLRGQTDAHGRFFFASVPGGSQGFQVVVKAKGRRQSVTVEQSTSASDPVTIRFATFDAR